MKFRTKILLAIWGVVLGLLIVTYVVIYYWMRVQVVSRFSEELKSNYSAVRELESLRENEIIRSSQIVAESPRLKAVVEIGDRNTAVQLSQELNRNMNSDLFILTNARGEPIVELPDNQRAALNVNNISSIHHALQREPSAGMLATSQVYRCGSVPIIIGPDLVGTLTLGFAVTNNDIRSIQSMTNSQVVLVADAAVLASTLDSLHQAELRSWLQNGWTALPSIFVRETASVFTIQTPANRFAATWCRLDHGGAAPNQLVGLLLLKPIESEVRSILAPVLRSLIVLSFIVLLLTAVIGFVISKGITRPIAALVEGTSAISRGNYDYPIMVRGGGELRYLAKKFEEMSHFLKEKISQLAERNAELETALQQLRETQEELVKSERLAATGRLTAQLAHEINNPIHNIQSCLQMVLKKTAPDSADRELLDLAYEEVGRLATLTRQMLDVYRTSMVTMERELLCLNDVVQEIVASSNPMLQDRNIAVDLRLDPRLPKILGSPDKLKQVFLNLIVNASDSMPHGGKIVIESRPEDGQCVVSVSDTGVGIPPENIHRIYDAFFTTKSSVSGVGLGLSVTYGIIKQHDGTISVQSTVGQGTSFRVAFPVPSSKGAL